MPESKLNIDLTDFDLHTEEEEAQPSPSADSAGDEGRVGSSAADGSPSSPASALLEGGQQQQQPEPEPEPEDETPYEFRAEGRVPPIKEALAPLSSVRAQVRARETVKRDAKAFARYVSGQAYLEGNKDVQFAAQEALGYHGELTRKSGFTADPHTSDWNVFLTETTDWFVTMGTGIVALGAGVVDIMTQKPLHDMIEYGRAQEELDQKLKDGHITSPADLSPVTRDGFARLGVNVEAFQTVKDLEELAGRPASSVWAESWYDFGKEATNALVDDYVTRFGFNEEDIEAGTPWARRFYERGVVEGGVDTLLDLSVIGALPRMAARTSATMATKAAARSTDAAKTAKLVARADRLDAAAEMLKPTNVIKTTTEGIVDVVNEIAHRKLRRHTSKLAPTERSLLDIWSARWKIAEHQADWRTRSRAKRQAAEREIWAATREIESDAQMQKLTQHLQGVAVLQPEDFTEGMITALRKIRQVIRKNQLELVEEGLLTPKQAYQRRYQPLAYQYSGKLLPPEDWTDDLVRIKNEQIRKQRAEIVEAFESRGLVPPKGTIPEEYMTRDQFDLIVETVKRDHEEALKLLDLPDEMSLDDFAVDYFPSFKRPDRALRASKVAGEFGIDPMRSPFRQDFQRHAGGNYRMLEGYNKRDAILNLTRHNAQMRKSIDELQAMRSLLDLKWRPRAGADYGTPVELPDGTSFWLKGGSERAGENIIQPLKIDPKTGDYIGLKPGYQPFNPDGALQFYKGQVDVSGRALRALENMDEVDGAIMLALEQVPGVTFAGAKKRVNLYQIPEDLASTFKKRYRLGPGARQFLYGTDKVTEVWKAVTLPWSARWHVNTLVGSAFYGATAAPSEMARGLKVRRMIKASDEVADAQALIPEELAGKSLAHLEGFSQHVGSVANTPLGRTIEAAQAVLPMRLRDWGEKAGRVKNKAAGAVIRPWQTLRKGVDDVSEYGTKSVTSQLYDFNSRIDDFYRDTAYLGHVYRKAEREAARESGASIIRSTDVFRKMEDWAKDPAIARELVKELDNVWVNFSRMSEVERTLIRRLLPFWSWYREIGRLTARGILDRPMGFAVADKLSDIGMAVNEQELQRELGITRKWLPHYLQNDGVFLYADEYGRATFLSPRGQNVFYGLPNMIFDPSAIHPVLKWGMEEFMGGRFMGKWGDMVPFDTAVQDPAVWHERSDQFFKPGWEIRAARQLYWFTLMEDLIEYQMTSKVTRRGVDNTPFTAWANQTFGVKVFRNEWRQMNREDTMTGMPRKKGLQPHPEKFLASKLAGFSVRTYDLQEKLEMVQQEIETGISGQHAQLSRDEGPLGETYDELLREYGAMKFQGDGLPDGDRQGLALYNATDAEGIGITNMVNNWDKARRAGMKEAMAELESWIVEAKGEEFMQRVKDDAGMVDALELRDER